MTGLIHNHRFKAWLWVLVLALMGSSLAQVSRGVRRPRRPVYQQPQQDSSTAEQEAEPNTANYPQRPAFTPGNPSTPYTQPSGPAYNQQAPAPAISTPPAQQINSAPQGNQAQGNPGAGPQGPRFIGPLVPLPPTPETMPPAPPKIAYQNGLLSVESVNSRLTDILNGIHNRTGIQFEGLLPGSDRVAGKFGPAPADEVLTSLLRGSRYDYVIVGVPDNPALVQRVILSPSSSAGAAANATGSPVGANTQAGDSEEEDSGEEAEGQQQEQVQAPPPQQVQPPAQPGQNPNGTPKTTEQLLEELKQMQQRNQQRQPPTAPLKPQ